MVRAWAARLGQQGLCLQSSRRRHNNRQNTWQNTWAEHLAEHLGTPPAPVVVRSSSILMTPVSSLLSSPLSSPILLDHE